MRVSAAIFDTPHPVAVVTGAGAPRIGREIAQTLAERGYRLAIHAHRSIEEAQQVVAHWKSQNIEAMAVHADLRDESAVQRMVDEVWNRFGRVDVLVNSAAIWNTKPLEDTSAKDVVDHFMANTLGSFLTCQHFGLRMVGQTRGGAIVNIGDWAIKRPYAGYAAYFPSKGAIPALTKSLAVEFAARNPRIRVNAVLPGPVTLTHDMPAAERERAINGTLVRREGHPRHVAAAVVSLVENDYLNGVCLPVDGGRTIAS